MENNPALLRFSSIATGDVVYNKGVAVPRLSLSLHRYVSCSIAVNKNHLCQHWQLIKAHASEFKDQAKQSNRAICLDVSPLKAVLNQECLILTLVSYQFFIVVIS